MQPRDDGGRLQRNPVVAAAEDGHNPAHNSEGTEHPTAPRGEAVARAARD